MRSVEQELFAVNRAALAYWRETSYSPADLDEVCRELDHLLAMRIDFRDDGTVNFVISREVERRKEGHFPAVVDFVTEAIKAWPNPGTPRGACVILLEDGLWRGLRSYSRRVPIFAFGRGREDNQTFLLPEPIFLMSRGYEKDCAAVTEKLATRPWRSRAPGVFWRGASSGVMSFGDAWEQAPRARVVLASEKLGDRALYDAKFSKLVGGNESAISQAIRARGALAEPVALLSQFDRRATIDVDGEMNAWSGYLKLASGSTVLKIASPHVMWYHDLLRPWEHFVPADPDIASIIDTVRWMNTHPEACEAIAERAREFTARVTYQASLNAAAHLLHEVLTLGRI